MKIDLIALSAAMDSIGCRVASAGEDPHAVQRDLDPRTRVTTGWSEIDRVIGGGLQRGVLHEWFDDQSPTTSADNAASSATSAVSSAGVPAVARAAWRTASSTSFRPALGVFVHLAWQALEAESAGSRRAAVWIGRACWPFPAALIGAGDDRRLLGRSIFVDPADDAQRVWAIDQALRSSAAMAVIADARRIDMTHSRRLQLAAESSFRAGSNGVGGRGVLGLMARGAADRTRLSAAATRWLVRPQPSSATRPHWTLELARCKGMRPGMDGRRCWRLRHDEQTNRIHLSADVADRSGEAALADVAEVRFAPVRQSA